MGSFLSKCTLAQHNNFVGISDGGKTVSYDDNGDVASLLSVIVNGLLDSLLIDLIQS